MIKKDAIELVFNKNVDMDSFVDFITEAYDTDPEFNEILIKNDEVWYIFEGPDWDSVEYDEDGDDEEGEPDTMVVGVIFRGNDAELKWIKSR